VGQLAAGPGRLLVGLTAAHPILVLVDQLFSPESGEPPRTRTGVPESDAPLPVRMRPHTVDEVVGQEHLLGPGKPLRRAIEEGRAHSMLLHGPPGSGKTTLARLVAAAAKAAFEELSAVEVGRPEVRQVLERAEHRRKATGERTVLFLDEIHRFNKAQQDSLLPAVEEGLITLIGATTENPYFEVNSALLSRCQIYELEPLTAEEVEVIVRRGAGELGADVPADLVTLVARKAGGDARAALNTLELAWATAQAEGEVLAARHVEDAARKRPLVYDKHGDAHYDFVSAFIKSIRGSDPDAALYYLAAMLESGEDPRYVARRLIVHASEDVGMADSRALLVAAAAAHAVEHVGLPEARLNLAHATIYLARAPKSNAVLTALGAATRDVREHGTIRPPKALRDTHYRGARKLGHGEGYVYPPSDPAGYELDYLPDELQGRTYYEPPDDER
jgi:putative ATPase